jgi:hypothetical protein
MNRSISDAYGAYDYNAMRNDGWVEAMRRTSISIITFARE